MRGDRLTSHCEWSKSWMGGFQEGPGKMDPAHLSSDQHPGYLLYIGDIVLLSYIGDYFISHEIRIPEPEPTSISWFMSCQGFGCFTSLICIEDATTRTAEQMSFYMALFQDPNVKERTAKSENPFVLSDHLLRILKVKNRWHRCRINS